MSTHHRFVRRAQLRSRALCEPHYLARAHLQAIAEQDPVVWPAGDWQRRLEGHLFRYLGYFHVGGKYSLTSKITRISAVEDSMEFWFSRVLDHQIDGLANALPTWHPGDGSLANGYPGLRYRLTLDGNGVEFYILGKPCSVTFRGLEVAAFEDACRIELPDLEGARTEPHLHRAEILSDRPDEQKTDVAVSAIIRRAGVLLVGEADSIDLWPTRPDRLSVEILTQDRSLATYRRIVSGLTSPHLSPRMTMTEAAGHSGYRTIFEIEGTDVDIDLRIQTL